MGNKNLLEPLIALILVQYDVTSIGMSPIWG